MDVVRLEQVDVLPVEPRGHHELAADLAREERHALVLYARAVKRADLEVAEVRRLDELGKDAHPVVGGVRRVVRGAPVLVREADEPRVLDPAALVLADREDDALGEKGNLAESVGQAPLVQG